MICQRHLVFGAGESERSSVFSNQKWAFDALRASLPESLKDVPLRIDLARHIHRPETHGPTAGLNFFHDRARNEIRPLTDDQLFRQLPISYRICRVYATDSEHAGVVAEALDRLIGPGGSDDLTNM
jgi:hypothetical protein